LASSQSGTPIVADTRQLSKLARDLRKASPEAWKAYRVAVRAAAQIVAEDAKSRASFSHRIPGSIKVRVTSGGNVKVVAGGDAAPDAAPIENKGKGFVRHPTFGRTGPGDWTSKNSHPAYLAPAFDAHKEAVMDAIERAVGDAVERALKGSSF
jgi:hypothetical protein